MLILDVGAQSLIILEDLAANPADEGTAATNHLVTVAVPIDVLLTFVTDLMCSLLLSVLLMLNLIAIILFLCLPAC